MLDQKSPRYNKLFYITTVIGFLVFLCEISLNTQKMIYKLKNSYLLFFVFLLIVVSFILSSVILIIHVNNIRQTVIGHVENISALSRFESETFLILSNIETLNDLEIIRESNNLISSSEVPVNTIDFSRLKNLLKNSDKNIDKVQIGRELAMYKKSCQYAIGENRKQLGLNSAKLSDYWNYTHILLISACVLLIIVSIVVYFIVKSKSN